MANLVRRETGANDLFDFRRGFDDIFNRFLTGAVPTGERGNRVLVAVPPIESWVDRENKKFHLSIALPGFDPKELQVELEGNNLTVSGEHEEKDEKKDADYLEQEFSYGRMERTIVLPEGVDTSKVSAEYNNGVLEITAPLSEAAMPKRIEVRPSSSSAKAKGASAGAAAGGTGGGGS
jgi:HSP20 family protein